MLTQTFSGVWQLVARTHPSLFALAWIAAVDRVSGRVILTHGKCVEIRERFFVEGVWNGVFAHGDFGDTDCIFGSGGILSPDGIRFVSSASTTDYLFYLEHAGQ